MSASKREVEASLEKIAALAYMDKFDPEDISGQFDPESYGVEFLDQKFSYNRDVSRYILDDGALDGAWKLIESYFLPYTEIDHRWQMQEEYHGFAAGCTMEDLLGFVDRSADRYHMPFSNMLKQVLFESALKDDSGFYSMMAKKARCDIGSILYKSMRDSSDRFASAIVEWDSLMDGAVFFCGAIRHKLYDPAERNYKEAILAEFFVWLGQFDEPADVQPMINALDAVKERIGPYSQAITGLLTNYQNAYLASRCN